MSELQKIEVSEGGESMKPMMGGEGENEFVKTLSTTGGKRRKRRGGGELIKSYGGNADEKSKTMGGKRNYKNGGKSRKSGNSGKSRKNRKSRSRSRK